MEPQRDSCKEISIQFLNHMVNDFASSLVQTAKKIKHYVYHWGQSHRGSVLKNITVEDKSDIAVSVPFFGIVVEFM